MRTEESMNARQSRIVARRMRHRSRSVAVVTALSLAFLFLTRRFLKVRA